MSRKARVSLTRIEVGLRALCGSSPVVRGPLRRKARTREQWRDEQRSTGSRAILDALGLTAREQKAAVVLHHFLRLDPKSGAFRARGSPSTTSIEEWRSRTLVLAFRRPRVGETKGDAQQRFEAWCAVVRERLGERLRIDFLVEVTAALAREAGLTPAQIVQLLQMLGAEKVAPGEQESARLRAQMRVSRAARQLASAKRRLKYLAGRMGPPRK